MNYGLLYHVRSRRDSQMALRYYRLAIAEGDRSSLFWMSAHQQLTKLLDELGRLEEAVEEQKKWRDGWRRPVQRLRRPSAWTPKT
ncbi:hypothetical protein [uncultured Acetatifactor sp.]|uniref:hypothetical protein n=1 Tax=uncultured Acetatifactor sp. TaxID=1671927 RepID=UPI0026163C48|nr:hypothetical protein [uncultured Acetatifactor sp.]